MSSLEPPKSPLAAFLRAHGKGVQDAWEGAERPHGGGAQVEREALREEMPAMLGRLAERIEGALAAETAADPSFGDTWTGVASMTGPEPLLGARALDRLRDGYDVEVMAAEHAILRRCVLRRLDEAGVRPAWSELAAFEEALDDAIVHPSVSIAAQRERALGALDRVSIEGLGSSHLDRLLRRLLEVLVESVRSVDWAALLLSEGEALRVRVAIGVDEKIWRARTYRLARGFVGRVVRERQPVALRSAALDPLATDAGGAGRPPEAGMRGERAGGELHALYGVPIPADGRPFGVAVMSTRRVAEFSEADRMLFRKVADRAAALITYTQMRDQVTVERARLDAVLRSVPVGVVVAEAPAGKIVLGNRKIDEILRGRDDSPASNTFHGAHLDLGTEEERARLPLSRALSLGETASRQEIDFLREDGERRLGEFSATPLRDPEGRIAAALMVVDDVTERRRAEQARRLLLEASGLVLDALDGEAVLEPIARLASERLAEVCVLDLLQAGAYRRIVASGREAAHRTIVPRLAAHPPAPGDGPIAEALARAEPVFVRRVTDNWLQRLARAPEQLAALRELNARSALLAPLGARGEKLGVLGLFAVDRELTPDDVLAATELARLVSIAIDAARLSAEARESVRARDELLSIAAHELRTPLSALELQIQSLRRALAKGRLEPDRLERSLESATRQSQRLARLLDSLLDLSRVTAGRLALEKEQADLVEIARDVLQRYEERLAAAGCAASFSSEGPAAGDWDRLRLEQVLANLLENAMKYAPGAPIAVAVAAEGPSVRLTVRDHGPGVPPEDRARIFAPFERASGAHAARSLGLGLYITRQIVEAHGGTIEVAGVDGDGAAFVVRLPRSASGG